MALAGGARKEPTRRRRRRIWPIPCISGKSTSRAPEARPARPRILPLMQRTGPLTHPPLVTCVGSKARPAPCVRSKKRDEVDPDSVRTRAGSRAEQSRVADRAPVGSGGEGGSRGRPREVSRPGLGCGRVSSPPTLRPRPPPSRRPSWAARRGAGPSTTRRRRGGDRRRRDAPPLSLAAGRRSG